MHRERRKEPTMSTQDTMPRRRVDSEGGALLLILAMVALAVAGMFAVGA
jgi:hypothetical protein